MKNGDTIIKVRHDDRFKTDSLIDLGTEATVDYTANGRVYFQKEVNGVSCSRQRLWRVK